MIKPQHFAALAAVTVVMVVAAAALNASSNSWSSGRTDGELLAPRLRSDINAVATVEVSQGDKKLSFARDGEHWTVKERSGYPAAAEKVRKLLLTLAEARLVEPKTAIKDRLAMLELEDPKAKDAKSHLVRVLDTSGRPIAEVLVGKSRYDAFGAGRSGVYVRRAGETQSWLATGDPKVPTEFKDWISATVFQIDANDILRVTLEHKGEAPLVIEKGAQAGAKYKIAGADGKKLKQGFTVEQVPQAFAALEVDDVRKLDAPPAGDDVTIAKLERKDGLRVEFRLRKEKDANWLSMVATGADKAKKSADDLNARVHGWEFKLPQWKADQINKRRADVFEAAT